MNNMLNGRAACKLNIGLQQQQQREQQEQPQQLSSDMETTAVDATASATASASASAAASTCIKINISNCKSNHPAIRSSNEAGGAGGGAGGGGGGGLLLLPTHTHHNLQLDKISVRSISSEDISNVGSGRCCSAAARNPAIKTGRRLQLMQVS